MREESVSKIDSTIKSALLEYNTLCYLYLYFYCMTIYSNINHQRSIVIVKIALLIINIAVSLAIA